MIEEKGEPAELGWPGSRRPARVGARAREGGAWAEKASGGQEPPDRGGGHRRAHASGRTVRSGTRTTHPGQVRGRHMRESQRWR